jgi:hypothetical protein
MVDRNRYKFKVSVVLGLVGLGSGLYAAKAGDELTFLTALDSTVEILLCSVFCLYVLFPLAIDNSAVLLWNILVFRSFLCKR